LGDELQKKLQQADAGALADLLAEGQRAGAERVALDGEVALAVPGYRLESEIHRGGQGVIYLAIQESTKRRVAIKVLREGPFAGLGDRNRFLREVEILGELRHPQIVAIHDSGVAAGCHYFVMDYIPGQPLTAWLAAGPHPLRATLELFVRICEAVNAAHLRGVIHRDLKPGNIQVDEAGLPYILDFGLAKRLSGSAREATPEMTLTGQFMGSLPWASPEQARGQAGQIDTRTDVYALGVILYQMLTGRFPYDVMGSPTDVVGRILHTDPARPSTLDRHIDGDVETIVLKCLAKEPERRYQTAGELARDVQRRLDGEPIAARRDSLLYVARKTLRRYRAAVAVGMVIVALLAAGLVSSVVFALRAQAQAALLLQEDYAHSIGRARDCYEKGQIRSMKETLYRCPAELRGWEWYHLVALSDQSTRTLRGHTNWIVSAALSPDGRRMATASHDNTVRVWDVSTGDVLWSPAPFSKPAYAVAFSPDGRRIICGTQAGAVSVWNMDDGRCEPQLPAAGQTVLAVAFSPDGRWAACVCADGSVTIWDAQSWVMAPSAPQVTRGDGHFLAFDADGGKLVCACASPGLPLERTTSTRPSVVVWDLKQQRQVEVPADMHGVSCLAFGPDGRCVLGSHAGRVWVCDADGQCLWPPKDAMDVRCVAFSPDGRRVASGSQDSAVRIWDAADGELQCTLHGHEAPVRFVSFLPNAGEEDLVSASEDGTIRFWDTRQPTVDWTQNEAVYGVAFFPDGRRVACVTGLYDAGDCKRVKIWDVVGRIESQPPLEIPEGVNHLAISPDGRWIVIAPSGVGKASLWDLGTGELSRRFKAAPDATVGVSFSPDGRYIACCAEQPQVIVLDVSSAVAQPIASGAPRVSSAVFEPRDGRILALGCQDASVQLWDWRRPERVPARPGHTKAVMSLAFSTDGKQLASGGEDGTIRIWDVRTAKPIRVLWQHHGDVFDLAFSPDGQRLLSGSYGEAKLWSVQAGEELMTFPFGHTEPVHVALSPDGARLALGTPSGLQVREAMDRETFKSSPEAAYQLARAAFGLAERDQPARAADLFAEALGIFERVLARGTPGQRLAAAQNLEHLLGAGEQTGPAAQIAAWRQKLRRLQLPR
jgi:WD40 repeat protein/tRNA A-37 threonylcarbamoyl transferase component Bud32